MKKDKQFSIRISTQDLETIRGKAAQAHMSQSDYLRNGGGGYLLRGRRSYDRRPWLDE